jgi:hypothetical protein
LKQLLMYYGMIASNQLKLIRQRLDRVFANDSLPPHDLDLLQFCIDLTGTATNTVCVIDGLHELSSEEASKVCGIIEELLQPSAAMKIAVFARETIGTDIQFDRLIPKTYILRLVLPLLTKDISTFVEMSVDRKMQREREISSNQRLVREIKDTLIKAGEKMSGPPRYHNCLLSISRFLWIHLQILSMWRHCSNDDEIREALEALPEGLDETYIRCLEQVDRHELCEETSSLR